MAETILERIAAGESGAVQECIDTYSRLLWSIALRFSRSPGDAEDAVQEIFVDLWKSAGRFDPARSSEKTFVAMIARRRLIDLLRRSERRPQLAAIPEDFDFADPKQERLEASAEASLAARALEALKPEQRRVLLLSVVHGLSHSEIVERCQLPLGTVKSHVRRGLAEIRQALGVTPEELQPTGAQRGRSRKSSRRGSATAKARGKEAP